MLGYIYKITNTYNNKVYIGKTIQKVQRRFKQHISNALKNDYRLRHIHLYSAIREHGPERFKVEVIESMTVPNAKDLNDRESYWITLYDSTNPEKGYNLTGGGDGGSHILPETVSKILNTKRENGTFHHSAETRQKISESHKGKKFTDEHKRHLSEHHHHRMTHILYYTDGHTELSSESIQKLAERLGTTAIKLRRASEVGEFRCGDFYLLDLTDLSLAFDHKYRYSKELCFYDPIRGDVVSHNTLRMRHQHNMLDYKGVVLYNYTEEKQKEKDEFINHYQEIKHKALK